MADINTRKARSAEIEVKVQARKARGYGDRGSGIGSTGLECGDRGINIDSRGSVCGDRG